MQKILKELVAEHLNDLGQEVDPRSLNRGTRFKEDLSMDSLDMIELVMYLEEVLGVDLDKGDIKASKTLGQAGDRISKYYGAEDFK
jgi:acyl carrier protein